LDNSHAVALACAEAAPSEVVIAVVDANRQFDGVYVKSLGQLYRTVMSVAPGGWSLVFSPGDSLPEIELRCRQMARYAEARYRLARRIASR